ncbi:hypothetical protein E2C01_074008 [Portunus trituberculatus]|uniref:Uncharacterized protein n=1 Tax=Portunus trituberculatus TaxID=210409 RepID=A0A5B7IC76_PORTR|nr:hypothetical protein [Portunus trituberculatus]
MIQYKNRKRKEDSQEGGKEGGGEEKETKKEKKKKKTDTKQRDETPKRIRGTLLGCHMQDSFKDLEIH